MNNNLIKQIKKMPFMLNGTVYEINNEEGNGYLYKSRLEYSIAIPFEYEKEVLEEFVGISLSTNGQSYFFAISSAFFSNASKYLRLCLL